MLGSFAEAEVISPADGTNPEDEALLADSVGRCRRFP
jgi:hypothetical protein